MTPSRLLSGVCSCLSALLEELQERGQWTKCYPALLAGAGIRGGQVYGASPKDGQCSPADIHATVHHVLGVPGDAVLADPIGREIRLHAGKVLRQQV